MLVTLSRTGGGTCGTAQKFRSVRFPVTAGWSRRSEPEIVWSYVQGLAPGSSLARRCLRSGRTPPPNRPLVLRRSIVLANVRVRGAEDGRPDGHAAGTQVP